jgi:flagellar basal-body rod protein FlgB
MPTTRARAAARFAKQIAVRTVSSNIIATRLQDVCHARRVSLWPRLMSCRLRPYLARVMPVPRHATSPRIRMLAYRLAPGAARPAPRLSALWLGGRYRRGTRITRACEVRPQLSRASRGQSETRLTCAAATGRRRGRQEVAVARAARVAKPREFTRRVHWHACCSRRLRPIAAWRRTTMDSILGIHESALLFRARRMDVLAANLANVDTPQYKARDMEFASVLDGVGADARLKVTDPRHISANPIENSAALQYRIPHQPSLDGNTVESDLELARYAENAVAYQASLLFAGDRIQTMRAALASTR